MTVRLPWPAAALAFTPPVAVLPLDLPDSAALLLLAWAAAVVALGVRQDGAS